MLKIKDNIDLKELEKFGFVKNQENEYICRSDDSWEIVGVLSNRHIWFELEKVGVCGAIIEDKLYVLYDLIQAGYVENEKNSA